MKSDFRRQMLNLIYGTPLESFARKAYMYLFQHHNYETDKQTVSVMQKILKSESNCIDIGCYRGEILRHMLRLAPQGEVFAFEPTPYHHDFLKKNFPRARLFQMAIGDVSGTAKFHFDTAHPARSGLAKIDQTDCPGEKQELAVKVDKLDNVIPADMIIDFIKIDVEGSEYNVINGGRAVIRRSLPVIVFEHGPDATGGDGNKSKDLYGLLCDDLGLCISTMDRWLAGKPFLDREIFMRYVQTGQYANFIAAK